MDSGNSHMDRVPAQTPGMFAKVVTERNADCNFCGTRDGVATILYGEAGQGRVRSIAVCPSCRKWFGDFLVSGRDDEYRDFPEKGKNQI